jgi:pyruvate kinase
MQHKILATLGPASLNEKSVLKMTELGVDLFRINLSHTKLKDVEKVVSLIQSWTDVPVCLDSEGAQIRNQDMISENVYFTQGSVVRIHKKYIIGDNENISFAPSNLVEQLKVGDKIRVDFNSVCFVITEKKQEFLLAVVERGGIVGSNKASDTDANIYLDPVTHKDKEAFKIGLDLGLTNFSLSFTNSSKDVELVRNIIGMEVNLISKIESIKGVLNLKGILPVVDQILIDRGDLSREVDIEKIPFLQRLIISESKLQNTPVFVATNLLESMIKFSSPTRAEANDVASTLIMGASGLVLAAETAIGKYPVESVIMIQSIIKQHNNWTSNSSIEDYI